MSLQREALKSLIFRGCLLLQHNLDYSDRYNRDVLFYKSNRMIFSMRRKGGRKKRRKEKRKREGKEGGRRDRRGKREFKLNIPEG